MTARGTAVTLAFAQTLLGAPTALWAASLSYSAPEACLSEAAFVEEVERLVGRSLAEVVGVDFTVEIGVKDGGFRASVRTQAAGAPETPRVREVTGATCAQATQAAAVVVALSARTASAESTQDGPVEPKTRPPSIEPEATQMRRPAARPRPDSLRVEVTAGAAGVADVGALAELAPGLAAEVGLAFGAVRIVAQGAYFFPAEHQIADGSGGRFTLATGALLGCASRGVERMYLAACAGFEVGELGAVGVGLARPAAESSLWLAPRLEIRPALKLDRHIRLFLGLGATAPLNRHRFLTNRQAVVHRAGTVTGRFAAGAEIQF